MNISAGMRRSDVSGSKQQATERIHYDGIRDHSFVFVRHISPGPLCFTPSVDNTSKHFTNRCRPLRSRRILPAGRAQPSGRSYALPLTLVTCILEDISAGTPKSPRFATSSLVTMAQYESSNSYSPCFSFDPPRPRPWPPQIRHEPHRTQPGPALDTFGSVPDPPGSSWGPPYSHRFRP